MLSSLFCFLFVIALVGSENFYGDFYEGDQVLRVWPDTKYKVQDILHIKKEPGLEMLDSWMPTFRPNHPADFYAKKKELSIMKKYLAEKSIAYSVLIDNVTEALLRQRPSTPKHPHNNGEYDYEKFHPLDEIHAELQNIQTQYPKFATVFNLGKSFEERDMKAIKISGNSKKHKKIFFMECGTHAREWVSPATCMWLIKEILKEVRENAGQNKKMYKMCNRIDWVIVPVLNVDGYVHSWTKEGRFWRKNRKPNNMSKCNGTDLNRNWSYKWGEPGSSDNPCSSSYRGTHPFSEIETRNVARYLYKNRCHLLGYIGFHSYSQFWMTPWGYKSEKPEHYKEMKRVADIAVKAIKTSKNGAHFEKPAPSSQIIYQSSGSAKDWTYGVLNIQYSYGVELRPHFNASYAFLIPPDQIKPCGEEITAAIKALSKTVHLNEGRRSVKSKRDRSHEH